MAYFTDAKGREWTVCLDAHRIQAIRDRYQIDLADTTTPHETWAKIKGNLPLTAMIAMALCEKQATSLSVTPDDFGEALVGDSIDAAFHAIHQAALDFFPQAGRCVLSHLGRQMDALEANAMAKAAPLLADDRLITLLIAEQDKAIQKQLETLEALILSQSAGSSPESLDSDRVTLTT